MRTIVLLMDSLNRHMLKVYNKETWVKTPNIDQFAEEAVVFDQHFIGSMPCMPARRDIFTGRLNFLERRWGPLEPFDLTLQQQLTSHGICSHIITDHTHYVEMGGSNYLQQFKTWDIHRGQEGDQWVSLVDAPALPEAYLGQVWQQYECNRTRFVNDCDYPTPKTFQAACDWAEANQGADNFFLMVESFDPHEPFDTPDEFVAQYQDDYEGPRFEWSSYDEVTEPEAAIQHLRKKYAATLTMADQWLGKFIAALKKNNLYEESLILLTTDHGHMLGEHGFTGKNFMHAYNEMAHIPLLLRLPGGKYAGEHRQALTQNIDLMPTILNYFNLEIPSTVMGHDLMDLALGKKDQVRQGALYGWHGMPVNVTDGQYTYFKAAVSEDNQPLNDYCVIPTSLWCYLGIGVEASIESGRFIPRTDFPVLKIPTDKPRGKHVADNQLFDISKDYGQHRPIKDKATEDRMSQLMTGLMKETEAPLEQYRRLGLDY